MSEEKKFFTVKQVAERYHVHEDTVRRWYREEKIDVVQISDRSIRIPSTEFEKIEKPQVIPQEDA